MNLKHLTDHQLTLDLKLLVQNERLLLTKILYHLKEVETRKLYSNYGCSSLFDYACKELKYSSDQAFRRIQAMRLLKSLPEETSKAVVQKIDSGELTLSNITQAQKFFKESKLLNKTELLATEKIHVLKKLINKSTRDGQKELLSLSPIKSLPADTKKQITATHTYVGFSMSEELERKLADIKTLLGPKAFNQRGQALTMAELIDLMADLTKQQLEEKKFGKRALKTSTLNVQSKDASNCRVVYKSADDKFDQSQNISLDESKPNRYISKPLKYKLWKQAEHKCQKCDSKCNLQIDHIKPMALGGNTQESNLRVLCFQCNQRQRIEARL